MNDLSKQSQALTNTLMPRNPIVPKNRKYQQHSEFGFSINDTHLKQRYKDLPDGETSQQPSFHQRKSLELEQGAQEHDGGDPWAIRLPSSWTEEEAYPIPSQEGYNGRQWNAIWYQI